MAMGIVRALLLLLALSVLGCGGDDAQVPPPEPQPTGCEPGELTLMDGSCRAAGVPAESCAKGFVSDGLGGCVVTLPPAPCPEGAMAIPGETSCREVAPCGSGTWGDIPIEPGTVYVDAGYTGGASDGTAANPWTSVQQAVDAAASGAMVAIAAGSYAENVLIRDKSLRLWGRCPAMVELVGFSSGSNVGTLDLIFGSSGSEVHTLAIAGSSNGSFVSAAQDVIYDRVWIHAPNGRGLDVETTLGPTSVAIAGSLIEGAVDYGIYLAGATVTLDDSVVRDTRQGSNGTFGRGVSVELDVMNGIPADATLRSSLITRNHEVGVFVGGSSLHITGVEISDTAASLSLPFGGRGISAVGHLPSNLPAVVELNSCVVERSVESGLLLGGTYATIDALVVRDTQPRPDDQTLGYGIAVQNNDVEPGSLLLTSSLIERTRDSGIQVSGVDVSFESVVVRDTFERVSDARHGRGINFEQAPIGTFNHASVRGCVIERSRELGVFVGGYDLLMEETVVRDAQAVDTNLISGRGLVVQFNPDTFVPSNAVVRASSIESSLGYGVMVASSTAVFENTAVRDNGPEPIDGLFGDGIVSISFVTPATTTITGSTIAGSSRAGVTSFGANVTIADSNIECNAIDFAQESYLSVPANFVDQGGNRCFCGDDVRDCRAVAASLEPPNPI